MLPLPVRDDRRRARACRHGLFCRVWFMPVVPGSLTLHFPLQLFFSESGTPQVVVTCIKLPENTRPFTGLLFDQNRRCLSDVQSLSSVRKAGQKPFLSRLWNRSESAVCVCPAISSGRFAAQKNQPSNRQNFLDCSGYHPGGYRDTGAVWSRHFVRLFHGRTDRSVPEWVKNICLIF